MDTAALSLFGSLFMMLLGILAVVVWHRAVALQFRWFVIGAGLWTIAIALKIGFSVVVNQAAFAFLQQRVSQSALVVLGALYVGLVSSAFEIGLTILAVAFWRRLGENGDRAIGIGLGAGAFEAMALGLTGLVGALVALMGLPGHEQIRAAINASAASTPLFWLVAPTERALVIPCHAAARMLVLLGYASGKRADIFWGFLLFTALDSVAGAAHLAGLINKISTWWIELAILPFAVISLAVIARSSSSAAALFLPARWRARGAGR